MGIVTYVGIAAGVLGLLVEVWIAAVAIRAIYRKRSRNLREPGRSGARTDVGRQPLDLAYFRRELGREGMTEWPGGLFTRPKHAARDAG
jgi:hypothetical protein